MMKNVLPLLLCLTFVALGRTQAQNRLSEKHLPLRSLSLFNDYNAEAELAALQDETVISRVNAITRKREYYRTSIHPDTGQERLVPLLFDSEKKEFIVCYEFAQGGEKKEDKNNPSQGSPIKSDTTQQSQQKAMPNSKEAKQPAQPLPRVRIAAVIFS